MSDKTVVPWTQPGSGKILDFEKFDQKTFSTPDWTTKKVRLGINLCSNLKELNIFDPLEEVEKMTKNKFKNILKEKIKKEAFDYLIKKKGIKGK